MELKPGFKQTEVGAIPEDWDAKQLGIIAIYTNGKAHEKNIKEQGRYIVVNSKFISSEGETRKYSDDCFCPTSAGDVLMVMSDVPNGKAIAKCFYADRDNCYTVNQRICTLRPTQVDGKLLFYKLNRNPFYLAFDDGVKQTNLRRDDVLSCPLSIPKSVEEQRAIAAALSDADALIESLDQLIAKKRDLKQAAMQQLLTGKQRLRGFHGAWKIKPIGDDVDLLAGFPFPSNAYCLIGVRLLRGSNVKRGQIDWSDEITQYWPAVDQKIARYALQDGDLVIAMDGSLVGRSFARLSKEDLPALLLQRVARIRSTTIDVGYLAQFVSSNRFINYCDSVKTVTAIPHISSEDIRRFTIPIPPTIEEQTTIATLLSDMDAELAALELRRDKIRALKQGMMQELLTGKTRLL